MQLSTFMHVFSLINKLAGLFTITNESITNYIINTCRASFTFIHSTGQSVQEQKSVSNLFSHFYVKYLVETLPYNIKCKH